MMNHMTNAKMEIMCFLNNNNNNNNNNKKKKKIWLICEVKKGPLDI